MRILYIFPHPDDESFGPSPAMARQRRDGHEVFLLTLTRGGATKERHKLDLSVDEMGEVRFQEMQEVAKVLDLSDMCVLDLPDSGLKDLDPRVIEEAIKKHIEQVKPNVVVTYAVHGISGFHDHLVTHAVVKRVYLEMRDGGATYLKRLAFFTLAEMGAKDTHHRLNHSTPDEIDCVVRAGEQDMEKFRAGLDCYVTYKDMIEKTGIKDLVAPEICFEIFDENHNPPLKELTDELP